MGNSVQLIPINHLAGAGLWWDRECEKELTPGREEGWGWRGLRLSLNKVAERERPRVQRVNPNQRDVTPETALQDVARFRRERVNFFPRCKSGRSLQAGECKERFLPQRLFKG